MSLFVRDASPFSLAADQVARAVQQALDATGQQLTVQLEVRTCDGKKAWRTICTYSDTVPAPKPEETWRRMWDLAGLLDEPQRSNIREKIEVERYAKA